jgi:tetratricopeptide (TPR) repeat protein
MFWGVGGNGKSWLLRKFREALPSGLPSALLDLDPLTGGTPYHADSARALAELRRQLAPVNFPRFDLAYAWLRYKEGVRDEPLLRGSGVAGGVFEFITEFAPVPGVGWLIKKMAKGARNRLKGTSVEAWLAKQVGQDDFQQLRQAETQDLYQQLTERFLLDAAENLPPREGKACRGVLFLDTFEALRVGVQGQAQFDYREAWVRDLHATDSPLLLVLVGRDQLRWHESDRNYADPGCLEQHLVGGLSESDARVLLGKCGLADQQLQDAVLRVSADTEAVARRGETSHHPFSLGLCADAVLEESARGRIVDPATFDMAPGDMGRLAQRFLKSLSDPAHELWVMRLALTPRFDEAAARAAFSPVPGVSQDAAWQALLGYSFVRDADVAGWWTFHGRMRAALNDRSSASADHRFWADYWRGRRQSETDDYAALTWSHHFHLTPGPARDEWVALATQLRTTAHMAEHYALLSWWEPIGVTTAPVITSEMATGLTALGWESLRASQGNQSENVYHSIECFTVALSVLTENAFPEEWGTTQTYLGVAYAALPVGDRDANLRKAIECYEAALRVLKEDTFPAQWATTQNNLGNAYYMLPTGDKSANLRKAIECYQAALRVRTKGEFPQEWGTTQTNLSNAYSELPDDDPVNRDANLRKAIECNEAALSVLTEGTFPWGWAVTQNHLGNAYYLLPTGDKGANLRKAIECYEAALRVLKEDTFPAQWAMTQDNLGNAYYVLPTGDKSANLVEAIAHYEAALRVRTEDNFPQDCAKTKDSLGYAYSARFQLQHNRLDCEHAMSCFEAAERGFQNAGLLNNAEDARRQIEHLLTLLRPSTGGIS